MRRYLLLSFYGLLSSGLFKIKSPYLHTLHLSLYWNSFFSDLFALGAHATVCFGGPKLRFALGGPTLITCCQRAVSFVLRKVVETLVRCGHWMLVASTPSAGEKPVALGWASGLALAVEGEFLCRLRAVSATAWGRGGRP